MGNQSKYYEVEGDKLVRNHRTCPKCGPSYLLGDHYDRWVCGNCAYTTFKRKGTPTKKTTGRRSPRKRVKSQ